MGRKLVRLRRLSQIAFLALFAILLVNTEIPRAARGLKTDIRASLSVKSFLQIDPFAAVSNALASHALYRGLLWSLLVIIPTLLLGRAFCGWVCPLGTLNHFCSWIKSESKRGKRLIESNRYKPWQRLKYGILLAALVAALLGSGIGGLLDPLSLMVRSLSVSILPALNYGFGGALTFRQEHFRQGTLFGVILLVILLLNFRISRFWCRALCPLGALLGWLVRGSVLHLKKDQEHCDECNLCLLGCQGGDDPIPGSRWRKAECHLCFNCVAACPSGGVTFQWTARAGDAVRGPNLGRRKLLAGVGAGLAIAPLLRSGVGLAAEHDALLIRPPGALAEKDFLDRCIRCGACMKVCPNNALQPAAGEAGVEGLWTPVLAPRIGYCEASCSLCAQVCPTGAIWPFTAREKGWAARNPTGTTPIRIGTAFYDRGRCLPWAMARECIVCEEWCPTSPKAIYLQPADIVDGDGNRKTVRQPSVDPARCVGCGACEFACPVQDRPAVYVTSVGESRSPSNQILLERQSRRRKQ